MAQDVTTTAPVLEREHELAVLAAVLEGAGAGRGGLVWIEGPSGIGKTLLLETAREQAGARGVTVLAARAARLERDLAFGVVRGLFEPLVAAAPATRRAELFAGAARLAAPAVAPVDDRTDPGDADAGSTVHGLYWLTANLAEAGPLLLVVDDAHVADTVSLRAVAYLARRVEELPVAIVLAAQPPTAETASPVLDALREGATTTVLRPAPLSRCGVEALVACRLAGGDPAFTAACHETTGGNPLLVDALLAAVAEAGGAADASGVAAVTELAPAVVATFVARRLREAGPDAAAVAGAVALLDGRAELRHAAAVTGLDPTTVAHAAETLVAVRLLRPGRPLTFAHPLFAQAVVDRTTPSARHRGHRRAADALAADGAGPELVAAHLLPTEALGDPVVVAWLREAGRAALAQGVPETAMTYLRRAVAEPPPPEDRAAVLHELGTATARVSYREGVALLEEAFATAVHPQLRGLIALELARALSVTLAFDRALEVIDEARAGLDDGDLATELAVATVGLARRDPARRAASVELARTLRRDGRLPRRGGAALLATSALDALQTETDTTAVAMAHEALTTTMQEHAPDPGVVLPATMVLVAIDDLAAVRACAEGVLASARRRGSTYDFTSGCVLRAQTRYLQGDLVEAEADARLADGLVAEHEVHAARRYTIAWLVIVLVERGRAAEAEEALAASGVRGELAYLLAAHGLLHLARGRPAEAVEAFTACGERLAHRGIQHPGVLPWRVGLAVSLHRLGREDEALAAADEAVRTARRFGAPRALAVALRARGLVGGAIEPLREALTLLGPTSARLELARTHVELGAALRRANRRVDARTELARGLDLARHCGAESLVARAGEELRAAGARPRRQAVTGADALTASERRVAELAADGLTNRDVAQALFVTTKTVETHLGHVYRKLGVSGRDELGARLV